MRKLKLDELGRLSVEAFQAAEKIPVIIVLDNIRSGGNVGAFFRSADAFLIEKIILCGITCQPPHKEILKTAIGSTNSVEWAYEEDVAKALGSLQNDYTIIGIEQTSESIGLNELRIVTDKKYAVVFGNEVEGLSPASLEKVDVAVEIPQYGTKHSLNVAVCGGIVMWHISKAFLTRSRSGR